MGSDVAELSTACTLACRRSGAAAHSCHRVGILAGLDNVGACSLPILRVLMDGEAVK